jgi:hypothetical protein
MDDRNCTASRHMPRRLWSSRTATARLYGSTRNTAAKRSGPRPSPREACSVKASTASKAGRLAVIGRRLAAGEGMRQ